MKKFFNTEKKELKIYLSLFIINILLCFNKFSIYNLLSVKGVFFLYFIILLLNKKENHSVLNKILICMILVAIIHRSYYLISAILNFNNLIYSNIVLNILYLIFYTYIIINFTFIKTNIRKSFYVSMIVIYPIIRIICYICSLIIQGDYNIIFILSNLIIPLFLEIIIIKYSYNLKNKD